jgi:uncharacterized membrane protein YhaH (DUF805 family)
MFSFSGTLSRKRYWHKILLLLLESIVVFSLLYLLMDFQDAEKANAPALNQIIAVTAFVLMILNGLAVLVAAASAIMRRARDIGDPVAWATLGILIPFGFLMIGFIPTKRSV